MNARLGSLAAALVLAAGVASAQTASAQTYPSKPIRVVPGFNAGGTDATMRLVAAEMTKTLGQTVLVDPVVGAGGFIAAQTVAKAAPDGYTFLFLTPVAVSSIFLKNFVDAEKAFDPVSNLCYSPHIIVVNSKIPARTFQELVAYSKANPNKLNVGSVANNTMLISEKLKQLTGFSFVHIPFKGPADIMTGILSGTLDVGLTSAGGWAAHVRNGAARVLLVNTPQRLLPLPDAPTVTELGINEFLRGSSVGLWAPKGTPRDAIQKVSAAAVAGVKNPEISQKMRSEAILLEPDGSTPETQLRIFQSEFKFYSEAARLVNFQPD